MLRTSLWPAAPLSLRRSRRGWRPVFLSMPASSSGSCPIERLLPCGSWWYGDEKKAMLGCGDGAAGMPSPVGWRRCRGGAAAALVSVASHYTLTEAILRRQAGESLAEIVAGLNEDWPEQLPYFTMVVGELRPETGQGVLVQAGHPPPLLLRHTPIKSHVAHLRLRCPPCISSRSSSRASRGMRQFSSFTRNH